MNLVGKLIQLDRDSPKRILVIGDCMFDTYVQGRLDPTCQEGCPKFIQESQVTVPGGAANAARSLENWSSGKRPYECTQDYPRGRYGVDCFPGKTPSLPAKVRFMVGDKCVWRYDDDKCGLNLGLVRNAAWIVIEDWKPHAVLLSDYDKGLLTRIFMTKVITHCFENNIPCVADVKREPELYRGAIIKSNLNWHCKYEKSVKNNHGSWVTTQGANPPFGYDCHTHMAWTLNPSRIEVPCINHVGAGDCFAAHLTLALAHKFSLKDAAAIAHSAGRVYVQKRYNEPPRSDDIEADMMQ